MRRTLLLGAVLVSFVSGPLVAGEPVYELIQPRVNHRGVVLYSAVGKARIESEGAGSRRLPLRSNELLVEVAETAGGWTASGIREFESGSELVLMRDGFAGLERLKAPGSQRHALRLRPSLVVRHEKLQGLAWLEGPDVSSLSVRIASWANGIWDEVSVVAPPARGSQTGLTGVALPDGTWLLVWSAFDGQDDEIFWSRGLENQWSTPQRLDMNNRVPDVMPTVVAAADGALLAWSRMIDGHYQLLMSHLRGNTWSAPRPVGPPGSLAAEFVEQGGRLHLIYRHAWPRAWAVHQLQPSGRTGRLTVIAQGSAARPVLLRSSADVVELQWPGHASQESRWEVLP